VGTRGRVMKGSSLPMFVLLLWSLLCPGFACATEHNRQEPALIVVSLPDASGYALGSGVRIDSPWTLSNVGGDTLFLNDLHYFPARTIVQDNEAPARMPEEIARTEAQRALTSSLGQFAHLREKSYEQYKQAVAEHLRSSSLVESVTVDQGGCFIVWAGDNEGSNAPEYFRLLSFEESVVPDLRSSFEQRVSAHRGLIAEFRRVIEQGGLVAFGPHGLIFVPRQRIPKMEEAIAKLQRGEPLTRDDVRDTPFTNKAFLRMYRQKLAGTGEGR